MYAEISKNANEVMNEIGTNPKCSDFMDEAKEVYEKLLKANIKNIDPK